MTDPRSASLEELEDFESEDFEDEPEADHSYLKGMWKSCDFRDDWNSAEDNLVVAHGMVESFINAFARDGRYRVVFDGTCSTAGTDMTEKVIVITPAPVIDSTLSAEQAGLILTGLAVHEISHPRYGRDTWAAVDKVFPYNSVASRLSNLLDDIRIERRFVEDYPGYSGVFAPTLEYMGKAGTKGGSRLHEQKVSDPVNLAIAATRYPSFSAWTPETAAAAAWWEAWADRWSKHDAPRKHVEAIREALLHVAAVRKANPDPKAARTSQPQASGGSDDEDQGASAGGQGMDYGDLDRDEPERDEPSGAGSETEADQGAPESTQSAASGAGDDPDEAPASSAQAGAEEMSDEDLNEATKTADLDETERAESCSGMGAVESAARMNGVGTSAIATLRSSADSTIENARNLDDDGRGNPVDVAQSLKGLVNGGYTKPAPSAMASRYIRSAILRSRGGHANVDTYKQRGRLDQRGITRIAYGDTRVFEKRTAPSPAKYLVWVMVDASGSMGGTPIMQASQVAHAMAVATSSTPSVRMEVWAWSDPFRRSRARVGVARVWRTGQDASEILRMAGLELGGTPDTTSMRWATKSIRREARTAETPVIIFVSDGAGQDGMSEAIADARRLGVKVLGVSFSGSNNQEARYGRGNWVPFAGSIIRTAKPLADLFTRMTGTGGK